MAKILSTFNEEKLDAPNVELIRLLKITIDKGESTEQIIRLTDRQFNLFSWETSTIEDDFTGDNDDPPDANLWTEYTGEYIDKFTIQNNKLNFDYSNDFITGLIESKFLLQGDFDVQIDFDIQAETGDNDQISAALRIYTVPNEAGSSSAEVLRFYSGGEKYRATFTNEFINKQEIISTTDDAGKFRIVRENGIVKLYVYTGGQWEWDGDVGGILSDGNATGDVFVQISSSCGFTSTINSNIDNFIVNLADSLAIRLEKAPPCKFGGIFYDPIILNFGTIKTGEVNPTTYKTEPSDFEFTIANGIPVGGYDQFTELLNAKKLHYALVEYLEIYGDTADTDDEVVRFKGSIEDLVNMQRDQVTVRCSGYELDISNKFSHNIVDTDTYPDADPDDVGKMLPIVYGSAKKVPLMAVDAGWATTLAEDIIASQTGVIKFSDVAGFDPAGTIQIGEEKIVYTSKSITANTLNITTRGDDSTTAVAHTAGDMSAQVQSYYDYIMGHPVKAFNAIYIDKMKQVDGFTAYTGIGTDQHPGYADKGGVRFTVNPYLIKQRNLDIDEGSHEHGSSMFTTLFPGYVSTWDVDLSGEANLIGNNVDTYIRAFACGTGGST